MTLITLNAGSSSLKFALFEARRPPRLVLRGEVSRLDEAPELLLRAADGRELARGALAPAGAGAGGQAAALGVALEALRRAAPEAMAQVRAVGHRIVHGGRDFAAPTLLDDEAMRALEALIPFAPLHQPHNLAAVRAARAAFPEAAQVGCFDTAFHRGRPFVAETYALPREWHARGVLRYGFHGLNYEHIARTLAREAPELARGRVVAAHLGAGASACAIRGGRSVASSMGFTALDGLVMATRCGQLDPGVVLHMIRAEGMSVDEVEALLYKRSGLLGLSGLSGDMRRLLAPDAPAQAREAVAHFALRARREIAALAAEMGGIDALVFTGGVGERSAPVRAMICEDLAFLGVALDKEANAAGAARIGAPGARVQTLVIHADEESVIADAAARLCAMAKG
ncbi:acetate/propionate family kinase [Oceanicella actignis]|uniref:Acetate kinase n=1 Tax=Oceanicella actignis TaxID=1189325 RepID=A0A1M7RZ11_9RHOB|nr:acetate/propionate family kinase [Oceanicella actignis]SES96433.1 acetate kinase [Oceanicella actignis]SHN51396.1 acetate kinase [Oceanicella actignis]